MTEYPVIYLLDENGEAWRTEFYCSKACRAAVPTRNYTTFGMDSSDMGGARCEKCNGVLLPLDTERKRIDAAVERVKAHMGDALDVHDAGDRETLDALNIVLRAVKPDHETVKGPRTLTKKEAVKWCNASLKIGGNPDGDILVAKGVDGDEELFTEIDPRDDIDNITDGTYHDFQVWARHA